MKEETIWIQGLKRNIIFRIGQNKEENHALVLGAQAHDMWFHVEGKSSCHVVACVPEGLSRKERGYIVRRGAVICRDCYCSKGSAGAANVSIVYAKIKHVIPTDVVGTMQIKEFHILSV